MPYLEKVYEKEGKTWSHTFDFRIPEVSSMVISGHKWPGCPWPTGIFLMRKGK